MARLTLKLGRQDVLFRVPTIADLWDVFDAPPVLPDEPDKELTPAQAKAARKRSLEHASKCLALCALRPVLLEECPVDLPEGSVSLVEVEVADRMAAYGKLLEAAGFTGGAAEQVGPSSAGEASDPASSADDSSISTDSPNATGKDQAA